MTDAGKQRRERGYISESSARSIMEAVRWPNGPQCVHCGSGSVGRIKTRPGVLKCGECRKQFTVTTRTVFADHKLPLSTIVRSIVMYEEAGGKVTAAEIMKAVQCSYRAALVMLRKIQEAHLSPAGILSEPSYMNRWYWQGFTRISLDDQTGRIVALGRNGVRRDVVTGERLHGAIDPALGDADA